MNPKAPHTTLSALQAVWHQRGVGNALPAQTLLDSAQQSEHADRIPFYAQTMMFFGAFLGGALIVASMFGWLLDAMLDTTIGQLTLSAMLICGAIILQRKLKIYNGKIRIFMQQLSLSLLFMGKGVLLYCVFFFPDLPISDAWLAVLIYLPVSFVTYLLYPVPLARVVSVCVGGGLVAFAITDAPPVMGESQIGLAMLWYVLCALVTRVILSRSLTIHTQPFVHGMLSVLAGVGTLIIANEDWLRNDRIVHWLTFDALMHRAILIAMGLVLVACVCSVLAQRLGGFMQLRRAPYSVAVLGLLVLAVLSAPCVLLAGIILVLGYGLSDKWMTSVGAALVPIAIIYFYYSMQFSLLHKSFMLMATGVVLLAAYGYVRRIHALREV